MLPFFKLFFHTECKFNCRYKKLKTPDIWFEILHERRRVTRDLVPSVASTKLHREISRSQHEGCKIGLSSDKGTEYLYYQSMFSNVKYENNISSSRRLSVL